MYPVFLEDRSLKFMEMEREQTLRTWIVNYQNPVTAIHVGQRLYYQTICKRSEGGEHLVKEEIKTSNGLSLFERIGWVMQRYPHAYHEKESGRFNCKKKQQRK